MTENNFDVVVIGGGPGGYVSAIRCAQLGFKTACIESRGALGGTCLNVGCIPSKALLESSHHFETLNHGLNEHGIEISGVKFNLANMLKRKSGVVDQLTRGIEGLFKKHKITYLRGMGSFVSKDKVKVTGGDDGTYSTKHVVIATGSVPIELPMAKFDHKIIVDSTDALSFGTVPQHLVVIGGGVIGMELGSVWLRLGAKVTVIEAMPNILGGTDVGVSTLAKRLFEKQGFTIHCKTKLKEAKVEGGIGVVRCEAADGSTLELQADKILVAVGRRPCTDGLNIESVGIQRDERGRVIIDAHFQTNISGIYAIGDVVRGPMLAHKAEDEGIAAAEIIAGKAGHVNYDAIPSVVYTHPEIASVGLSEEACKEKGLKYKKGQFPFLANGRAKALGYTEGFVKILADEKTDKIIGFHIIGPQASELIAEAAIAVEYQASAEDIARSAHAHPTLSEVMKEAALSVDGRAIHI